MRTVIWISVVGGSLLFFALAGLVGLMYLLTAPWLFSVEGAQPRRGRLPRRPRRAGAGVAPEAVVPASEAESSDAEQERRRRAAALAVATACAEEGQMTFVPVDTPADWRLLHRARRLSGTAIRRRVRP